MKLGTLYKSCWPSSADYKQAGGHIDNPDKTKSNIWDIGVKMCHTGVGLVTSCPHRRQENPICSVSSR